MPSYFFLLISLAFLCNSHNENPSARLTPSAQDMWRSRLLNLWGLQWLSGDDTDCIFLESSNSDVYDHFEGAVAAALHGLAAPARRSRCNSVKLLRHNAQSIAEPVPLTAHAIPHSQRTPSSGLLQLLVGWMRAPWMRLPRHSQRYVVVCHVTNAAGDM